MRRLSWATAALLALSASLPARAQMLTEQQFLEDVLANHPAVAAAEAGVAEAAGLRRYEGTLTNPELSWEREDPEVVARQDTWRLTWRLPFDGRQHRVAAADAAVAASTSMLDATRFDIRREMRELYSSWYVAVQREAAVQVHLDHTRRLADWLRSRAEQGEAAGVEARRLELEVEILSRQLVEARADARARRAAAAAWSPVITDGSQPDRPLLAPPPGTVDIDERADLEALAQRVAEAEALHRLWSRVAEPPDVSVGWLELDDATRSFAGPVFGVAWPVPIFDRNQGKKEAAAAGADRARAELEVARRDAVQRAEAALASYSDLYRAAALAANDGSIDDVVNSVLAAFEAGEASLTDVLDSLRTTFDVRIARLEILAGALAAQRELEAAVGRPILPGGSS